MAELKVKKHAKAKKAGKKPRGVVLARLTDSSGRKVTVRSVDANSPTFGEDFLYVFTQNVKAARKENKAKLGSLSGAKKAS
jgi:hypothetical protein